MIGTLTYIGLVTLLAGIVAMVYPPLAVIIAAFGNLIVIAYRR